MKIKKINKKHNQFTVDIEVANTHSYQLDNGCVTHNTSSLVLQSASGIHPHHARKYFRRVQCNKHDPVYIHFKKTNPHMCEESVWSANKTDDVITFPVKISPVAMVKADLTAISHLEKIKSTQINWVLPGSNSAGPITHNVSCTVIVDESEWDEVFTYLYENRAHFAAVAFLPKSGDKIYQQAPNEAITTETDELKWQDIVTNYKPVSYKALVERTDNTSLMDTVACGGGACEIDLGSATSTLTR